MDTGQRPRPQAVLASSGLARALVAGCALLLIVSAWHPGLEAPYQYDDYVTPLSDPASQSLSRFWHALPGTLRPLTKLTYALESSLGVGSAPGRRWLNLGVFAASAGLVAGLSQAAGLTYAGALGLATLWAVHPVHAETLLALAGRSVLLSLCLQLASALCLVRQRSNWALAFALLALGARETALVWLVVCAGLIAHGRGARRMRLLGSMLAVALLGGLAVLVSSRMRELLAFSFGDPSAGNRLGLQWAAVPHGLWLWLCQPGAFTLDMEFAPQGGARLAYVLTTFALYATALWVLLRARSSLLLRVLSGLWLALVLPTHSVVPKLDALTARSVSGSSAALVALLALALSAWLKAPWARAACGLLLSAWLVLLFPQTRARAALYRDPIALWRDAAAHTTRSVRPLINLGTLMAQAGQLEPARAAFEQAVRRNPHSSEARARLDAVTTLIETQRLLTDRPGRETVPGR
ncbi:MAG TPA: hypothetical protein VFZ61_16285 [Polyangiales bacterium]